MKKRVTLDRYGNPVIETKNKDGVYERVVDVDALKKMKADELSLASGIRRASGIHRQVGRNPYSGATVDDAKKLRKRSGLDYLRTLSQEIKKRRGDD
jgi:hypothetical protein